MVRVEAWRCRDDGEGGEKGAMLQLAGTQLALTTSATISPQHTAVGCQLGHPTAFTPSIHSTDQHPLH
jgi:hypothetical protein